MEQGEPMSEAQRTVHMPLRMHIIMDISTKLRTNVIRPVSSPQWLPTL